MSNQRLQRICCTLARAANRLGLLLGQPRAPHNLATRESARTFYNCARAELVERIRLRDNIFVFYPAAVGAVFGVALGTADKVETLLLLPFLGLGVTMLISQHFAVIGALAAYCVLEVGPFLCGLTPSEDAPQWDNSKALADYRDAAILMRTWGHALLIILPSIGALGMNWKHGICSPSPLSILWWAGVVCLVAAGVVMQRTHKFRKKINESFQWRK